MFNLTRLHQMYWPIRLLIAVVAGLVVDWLFGIALTALYWSLGIWNKDVLLSPYALLPLVFRSSCAAFVSALIFGRLELLVAILQHTVLAVVGRLVIGVLPLDEGMPPVFRAALGEGFAANPLVTGIEVGLQAVMLTPIGAYLAYIIRKYREARTFGQRARSMPARWNFRLGGALIFALGAGLGAFSLFRVVTGAFFQEYPDLLTAGISGFVLFPAAMLFGRISAFGRRLMAVREFVPEAGGDFLLIRSFEDDRIPCRPAYPFWLLNPIIHEFDGRTLCDTIVALLNRHGQTLAIGNPNEIVGTMRPYFPVETEGWKGYVRNALRTAKVIVVVAGSSEGLAWEMSEICRLGALMRTLFVLPAEGEKKPAQRTREKRVEALEKMTGLELSARDLVSDELTVVRVDLYGKPSVDIPEFSDFRRLRDVRAFLAAIFKDKIAESSPKPRSSGGRMPAASFQRESPERGSVPPNRTTL